MSKSSENIDNMSAGGIVSNDIQLLSNKIRMPRLHEFDCKIQKLVNDQFQVDKAILSSENCIKCEINSTGAPVDSSVEDQNLCRNCHLDNLVNRTVNDVLTNVFWNELYATGKKYQHSEKSNNDLSHVNPEPNEDNITLENVPVNSTSEKDQSFRSNEESVEPCIVANMENIGVLPPPTDMVMPAQSISNELTDETNKTKMEDSTIVKDVIGKRDVLLHIGSDLSQNYNKKKMIGCGKFGKVYQVIHHDSGILAAAKEIPYRSNDARTRICEEIDILKHLSGNEYIVQLYEAIDCCSTKPKMMILITEYLEGGELFDQIAKDDLLTETQVIHLMKQVLNGVNFIHQMGIIHRDLKPENIIYRSKSSDQIKIIDFGFAVRFDKNNPPKSMVGTTIFVAPEVLRYENQSYQTDIWSVGVIAYNLLAGITPFEIPQSGDLDRQMTDIEIIENIERCRYDFEDEGFIGVSDEAKSFITQILIRQPEERMTSAQCLQHAWLEKSEVKRDSEFSRSVTVQRMKNYVALKKWGKIGMAIQSIKYFKTSIMDS